MLEGAVEFRLGEDVAILNKGGFALIPRGQVHSFTTLGEDPAKLLVMVLPAGFEHVFEEMEAMRLEGMEVEQIFKVVEERYNTTFLPNSDATTAENRTQESEK